MLFKLFIVLTLALSISSVRLMSDDGTGPNPPPFEAKPHELTPTQTILSSSPKYTSVYSEKVRFVVKVVPTYVPGDLPSGPVQFFINNELVDTQPLINNIAAYTASSLPVSSQKPHRIKAIYMGDQTYAGSTDLLDFTVLPLNTATKVSSSLDPAAWGEPVQFTVNVYPLPPASAIPQGSINLQIEGYAVKKIPLDEKGHAVYATTDLEVGDRLVTVTFLGDENFNRSSKSFYQQIHKTETTTALTTTETPSIFGRKPEIAAKVSSSIKERNPAGEVEFQVDGQNLRRISLNDQGEARMTLPVLTGGNHLIAALYSGDEHFYDSKDALVQRINQAATKNVLTSSANPSLYGPKVIFTDSVTAEDATPSGFVDFMINGEVVTNQKLDAAGNASYAVSNLEAGKYTIEASYHENRDFKESSAQIIQEVDKANSATEMAASKNPSFFGSTVVFKAQVSSEEKRPLGSVQFLVDDAVFQTKKLDASGRSAIEIAKLEAGEHKITANYLGSANFKPSSASINQQVKKVDTEVTLSSSENPSTYGSGISFDAGVSSQGVKLQGSVQFLVDGNVLETKKVDSLGRASVTIPGLSAGRHVITANFLENSNFNSSSGSVAQQIQKADTKTSLAASENPGSYGSEIVFTATVVSLRGKPEGSFAFKMDGTVAATVSIDASGQSMFKVSDLEPGKHDISATYLGSPNYSESSASLQQTIEPPVEKEEAAPEEKEVVPDEKKAASIETNGS